MCDSFWLSCLDFPLFCDVYDEGLHGHRYMATGKWQKKTKNPDCFRVFSPVFACFRLFLHFFRSFLHFLGCLLLTVFGRSVFALFAPFECCHHRGRFLGEGDATKRFSVQKGFFCKKGGRHSVTEEFGIKPLQNLYKTSTKRPEMEKTPKNLYKTSTKPLHNLYITST